MRAGSRHGPRPFSSACYNRIQQAVKRYPRILQTHGFSHGDALSAAYARVYSQLQAQTHLLAFMDCFHVIGAITLIAAPLALLTRRFKIGGGAPVGH